MINVTTLKEILNEREERRKKEPFSIADVKIEIEIVIQIFMRAFNKLEQFPTENLKEEIFTYLLKLKEKIDEVNRLDEEENQYFSNKNLIIDIREGKGILFP